jgi:aspartate racemase
MAASMKAVSADSSRQIIGILGGMGPLASAAFVTSIYAAYRGQTEQDTPIVLLYSNPQVPDRSATLINGTDPEPLLRVIDGALSALVNLGARQLVICCVTAHFLLRSLSPHVRDRVISLVDVILQQVRATPGRCLLVSTSGSRRAGVLQQHPLWRDIEPRIAMPTDEEQAALHDAIYDLKQRHDVAPLSHLVDAVAARHRVQCIVAGCTELHLLSAVHAGRTNLNTRYEIIDPLTTITRTIREQRDATALCP